ncbi:MAG: pyridoxal phosphate-dependent aminotransferase [Solobacterium sp.]|nr:pyridoxal phosphate-dependent aminotransferase [Solobacterium sp.]
MTSRFDDVIDRSDTISIKWAKSQLQDLYGEPDLIALGIADMDFRVSPAIAEAVQNRAAHENYGYAYPSDEYLDACVNWQKRRNHWEIKRDWITYTPGLNVPLTAAVEIFTEPGDNVIIQSPVYYPYYHYVQEKGRNVAVNVLVNRDGYYEINFEDLEAKAKDPKTKAMILCSPHNPVGRNWTKEELTRIGRICIDNGVKLAVDEIHSDLVFEPNVFVPFATISDEFAQNAMICTSPSKSFNLAGLLNSDIIIPNDEIRAAFRQWMDPLYLWPGAFGAVSQIAAYNDSEEWLEELKVYLKGNAEYVAKIIKDRNLKIKYAVPEATYLGWLDFRAYGMTNEELWDFMIHEAHVATDDGPKFGFCGDADGFQRLNFACPRSRLIVAMERIADALEKRFGK